eukprot:1864122-Prymnesium_polylepis.2
MFVLDETTELAAKMLSKTCPSPHNFRLMRKVAAKTETLVFACADWDYDATLHRDMDRDAMGRCNALVDYMLRERYPARDAPVT